MSTRDDVVQEAKTWLGTPYHHHAHIKGAGVDCAQILLEVYSAIGLAERPDVGHYAPDWMLHRSEEVYLSWLDKYCKQITQQEAQAGDIVMFKFGRCFSHSGIILQYPLIIHAHITDNCCYADATQGDLAGRARLFYTLFKDEA